MFKEYYREAIQRQPEPNSVLRESVSLSLQVTILTVIWGKSFQDNWIMNFKSAFYPHFDQ